MNQSPVVPGFDRQTRSQKNWKKNESWGEEGGGGGGGAPEPPHPDSHAYGKIRWLFTSYLQASLFEEMKLLTPASGHSGI